jgi:AMP-binding enzyme C-terminal domain
VRDKIGPVAFFKRVLIVERLPKTRSGKVLRGTMQKDRQRRGMEDAGDHRGPGGVGGDRRGAADDRLLEDVASSAAARSRFETLPIPDKLEGSWRAS